MKLKPLFTALALSHTLVASAQFSIGLVNGCAGSKMPNSHALQENFDPPVRPVQNFKIGYQGGLDLRYRLPKSKLGVTLQALYAQRGLSAQSNTPNDSQHLHFINKRQLNYWLFPLTVDYYIPFGTKKKWSIGLSAGVYMGILQNYKVSRSTNLPEEYEIFDIEVTQDHYSAIDKQGTVIQTLDLTHETPLYQSTDFGVVGKLSVSYNIHPKLNLGVELFTHQGLKYVENLKTVLWNIGQPLTGTLPKVHNTAYGLALLLQYQF